MDIIETNTNLWEVLAGRASGVPLGPSDVDLWQAVNDRLNPAKARPQLRLGVEEVAMVSVRGQRYVMLRSPDDRSPGYLRLTPEEARLAHLMDGTRSVAALVGEMASISGTLAPDRVLRLVADLAGNKMLEELPVDSFHPLEKYRATRGAMPRRMARSMSAAIRGQRMILANPNRLLDRVYRGVGRFLFTKTAAVVLALLIVAGLVLFARTWLGGAESIFLVGDSYLTGALVLLGVNVIALSLHELGHGLAAKHAGRSIPSIGFVLYFGIPSVFVDTSDVWMAGRKARLLTSAAGPISAMAFAGGVQLLALGFPALGPLAFKIAFAWYLNSLFNLNPLMALDGYYMFMDWLEVPNLRPRAMATLAGWVRRRRPRWSEMDREGKLIAVYAVLALVWLVVMLNLSLRIWRDRIGGLITGLWHAGLPSRLLVVVIVAGLTSPLVFVMIGWASRVLKRLRLRASERDRARDLPRRVEALRNSALGQLEEDQLVSLAEVARWVHPGRGSQVVSAGPPPTEALLVVDGALEAREREDPPGTIRARARAGDLIGLSWLSAPTPTWIAAGTSLLAIPIRVLEGVLNGLLAGLSPSQAEEERTRILASPVLAGPILGGPGAAASTVGGHPSGGFPLLPPAADEPPSGDSERDRRFTRSLLVLLLILLMLALATVPVAARDAIPWAEMRSDRVMLSVEEGNVEAIIGGESVSLDQGQRRFLGEGDRFEVGERSIAALTFRGGGKATVCPLSRVTVGSLGMAESAQPEGEVMLAGMLIADTSIGSDAFELLALTVINAESTVVNEGPARFGVGVETVVEHGTVMVDGVVRTGDGTRPMCPSGSGSEIPTSTTTTEIPTTTSTTASTTTTTEVPTTTTTTTPPTTTTLPPTTTTTRPTTTTTVNTPPSITGVVADPTIIASNHPGCQAPPTATIRAVVSDNQDATGGLTVNVSYLLSTDLTVADRVGMTHVGNGVYEGQLGPFPWAPPYMQGGFLTISVWARDSSGATTYAEPFTVILLNCEPEG